MFNLLHAYYKLYRQNWTDIMRRIHHLQTSRTVSVEKITSKDNDIFPLVTEKSLS